MLHSLELWRHKNLIDNFILSFQICSPIQAFQLSSYVDTDQTEKEFLPLQITLETYIIIRKQNKIRIIKIANHKSL